MKQKNFDSLGRIHISKEIWQKLGITDKTPLEISVDLTQSRIIIEKKNRDCIVCGRTEDLIEIKEGAFCCKDCIKKIAEKI